MEKEHDIVRAVYAAKENNNAADDLIRRYIPYIRAESSKYMGRICTYGDDEFSIAMIAFHEAILGYSWDRGSFLSYAAMLIRNRLIDYNRKEKRHQGNLSLDMPDGEDGKTLLEQVADSRDLLTESQNLEATQQEIAELAGVLQTFGVSFADVADHSPKQERTKETCLSAIRYAMANRQLLDELLQTGKLPLAELVRATGCARKTLERHRKYVLAMLVIQTNGYEIIRGHLRHVWKQGGVRA
jgi:RNA polymerase sigma factor